MKSHFALSSVNFLSRVTKITAARFLSATAALLVAVFLPPLADAAVVTWVSDLDGNWGVPAKWSSNPNLPGPSDDVSINRTLANPTISHNSGTDTIKSLTCVEPLVISGGSLTITSTSTISGGLTVSATLGGTGNITVSGPMTWNGGGAMTGTGRIIAPVGSSLTISGNCGLQRPFDQSGATTWSSGGLTLTGGTFNNLLGATFTASGPDNTNMLDGGGTNVFSNSGSFVRSGSGEVEIRVPFNSTGTVNVSAGELSLKGGGSASGSMTVASGATLRFDDDYTLNSVLTFSGTGGIELLGGALTVNSPLTISTNPITLDAGELTGSGNLTTSGGITWKRGTMSGTGHTIVPALKSMTVNTTGVATLSRALDNYGSLTWSGGNWTFNGGTLTNQLGGVFTLSGGDGTSLNAAEGTNAINNYGSVVRNGSGSAIVRSLLNNYGTVTVTAGELELDGHGSSSGAFVVQSGAALSIASDFTFNLGSSLSGGGTLEFKGGTQTLNAPLSSGSLATTISGGELTGTGALTVAGPVTWTGGTVSGDGALTVNHGATLTISDTSSVHRDLTNNGVINWTGGNIKAGDATITNAVGATFNDQGPDLSNMVIDSGTNVFSNLGVFNRSGSGASSCKFEFDNSGTLNVTSGQFTLDGGGGGSGVFNVSAGATLALDSSCNLESGASFLGSGALVLSAGTQSVNGPVNLGTLSVSLTSGSLAGDGDATVSGPFTWSAGGISGTGKLILTPSGSFTATNGGAVYRPLDNSGPVTVTAGELTLGGSGTSSGPLTANLGASLRLAADRTYNTGAVFGGAGAYTLAGSTNTFNSAMSFNSGTLTISAATLTGPGSLTFGVPVTWSGGTLGAGGSATVSSAGSVTASGDVTIERNLTNLGYLALNGPSLYVNSATVTNSLGATLSCGGNNSTINTASSGNLVNNGTLTCNATGVVEFKIPVENTGSVEALGGTLKLSGGYTQTAGSTRVDATLDLGGAPLTLTAGTLTGVGSVTEELDNTSGVVSPGPAGTLSVTGAYTQGDGGTLHIDVVSATSFGALSVSGDAQIGGALEIELTNGYKPAANTQIRIMTAANLTGRFSSVSVTDGTLAHVEYLGDGLRLTFTSATPQGNGKVLMFWDNHATAPPQNENVALHPDLAGVIVANEWRSFEPQRNVFDFSGIDALVDYWAGYGKQVIIRNFVSGINDESLNIPPDWVFDSVPFVEVPWDTDPSVMVRIPDSWNSSAFMTILDEYVSALAAHFDGDPRVRAIWIGAGHLGLTSVDSNNAAADLVTAAGWTGELWQSYLDSVVDLYASRFQQTPVALAAASFWIAGYSNDLIDPNMAELTRRTVQSGGSLIIKGLDPDPTLYYDRPFSEMLDAANDAGLPPGFAMIVGDDFPLWVDEQRRIEQPWLSDRDDAGFEAALNILKDEWGRTGRKADCILMLLDTEVLTTLPGEISYRQSVADILQEFLYADDSSTTSQNQNGTNKRK